MRARLLLLSGAIALGACEAPTMPSTHVGEFYEFRLEVMPPQVLRWESGATIRVYATPSAGARAGLLEDALDRGLRTWNDAALYGEYDLVRVDALASADVVLRWSDEAPPVDMDDCPPVGSRAVTTFCLDASRTRLRPFMHDAGTSSVRMVVTVLAGEATRADRVERLVVHELGHVLGIVRHSLDADDLMYGGELSRESLSARDAATIRMLYHTRADVMP